jgi:L-fuconolactonase
MHKFPVTDAHLHLFDTQILDYAWLSELPQLSKPHTLTDMQLATAACDVETFIFVQFECAPTQSLAEVAWVTDQAKQDARIAGIIARAAIEKGLLVFSELEALKANPLVKGVRRLIQSEVDPFFCMQPDFIDGTRLLSQFDFTFDICIKWHQLPQAIYLVTECPNVQFVLDHLGKPDIADNRWEPWREHLAALAQLPNVVCKLSGLTAEVKLEDWQISDMQPFVDHAIEQFGTERVLFGSDWPIVDLNANYQRWLETVFELLKAFPEVELRKMLNENARKIYKVNERLS